MLNDLIARVESATPEMERELLVEGFRVLRGGMSSDFCLGELDHPDPFTRAYARKLDAGAPLDAALMLVEVKDRWPQIEYLSPNPNNSRVGHRVCLWTGLDKFVGKSRASFALALLAARLKQEMNDG